MKKSFASGLFAVILSGCATPHDQPSQDYASVGSGAEPTIAMAPSPKPGKLSPAQPKQIDLTAFIDVSNQVKHLDQSFWLGDLYARILVEGEVPEARPNGSRNEGPRGARIAEYKKRNALARLLVGNSRSAALVANVKVDDPEVHAPLPLLVAGHDSSNEGEHWAKSITPSTIYSPFFRISPSSTLSVGVEYKLTRSISSQAVRLAIELVTATAGVSQPVAKLVTKLSEQKLKARADSLDNSINRLFAESISEQVINKEPIAKFATGKGVQVLLYQQSKDDPSGDDELAGTWTIKLSKPRPSVFSDVQCATRTLGPGCTEAEIKLAYAQVSYTAILGYAITDNVTIRDYVTRQDWFVESISRNNPTTQDARAFCNNLIVDMFDLGLSRRDALMVLWATHEGISLPATLRGHMPTSASCQSVFDQIKKLKP